MSNVCPTCEQVVSDMGDAVEAHDRVYHNDCFCILCGGTHDYSEEEEWN